MDIDQNNVLPYCTVNTAQSRITYRGRQRVLNCGLILILAADLNGDASRFKCLLTTFHFYSSVEAWFQNWITDGALTYIVVLSIAMVISVSITAILKWIQHKYAAVFSVFKPSLILVHRDLTKFCYN